MKKIILGFCIGSIGITVLSSMSDIIITLCELIKAKMGIKIAEYGAQINKINGPLDEKTVRAIGFNTCDLQEEEDSYD